MRIDPSVWVLGLAGCTADWFVTRFWRRILLSFFPLVLALTVGVFAIFGSRLDKDRLAEHYLTLANSEVEKWENEWAPRPKDKPDVSTESESAVDPDAAKRQSESPATQSTISPFAEVLFRRVQQLQQSDSRSVFFVAMSYLQRGAAQQAYEMLKRLAPHDRVGYLPAHAFLAEALLSRPINASEIRVILHHAEAAMRWDRVSAKLLAQISKLYEVLDDIDRAVAAMSAAAERSSDFLLPLAKLASREKKFKVHAEQAMTKALALYEKKLSENPRNIQSRLLLADALVNTAQFQRAEALLVDGLKLEDSQTLKTALSEIYCAMFVATSRFTETAWEGNIELLDKAFRLDPNNGHIFDEVAKLARFTGSAPHEQLMAELQKNLAEGRATSITHTWIAERFLVLEQYAEAIPHLEQAVKRDPTAARCWNNLAYCLNEVAPERREEALACAETAIRLQPKFHDYYDTRGTIMMKLGKPRDAITSFERAIELIAAEGSRLPPQVGYHDRLAEAYQAIGNVSMAKTHTELAADSRKRAEAWSESNKRAAAEAAARAAQLKSAVATPSASANNPAADETLPDTSKQEPSATDATESEPTKKDSADNGSPTSGSAEADATTAKAPSDEP